jgi:hypothetical protein
MSPSKLLSLFAFALIVPACSDDTTGTGGSGAAPAGAGGSGGAPTAGSGGEGGSGGSLPPADLICGELGLPSLGWSSGPYGTHRGEVAEDFTLSLVGGSEWNFLERFAGCESYVFVPDTLVVSAQDDTSIWEKDLDDLWETSPRNAHYFFVSRKSNDADAQESITAMQGRVDELVARLSPEDAVHARGHLHVVATRAADIDSWVGDMLSGIGRGGFAIDRGQRLRGLGNLADVNRYSAALANAGDWPWKSNLAYAAHEVVYMNAEAELDARLAAEDVTEVKLFDGEILEQFEETDVMLPSAAEMAEFDTLEIEVISACPDPDQIEFGNCGAWDYLAWLSVRNEADQWVEMARFITSYHRETRWVVDASQMLPLLAAGGMTQMRWDFAPEWNTQPTATKLSLRFSNRKKGYLPDSATFLWAGGPFNSAYNTVHLPVDVPIPADAVRVELYALVTGHGAATGQCAEFCNHQHEVTVNGTTTLLHQFPEAGTEEMCVPEAANGMVPNQGGTWWFGRGGWCPGQQVKPWVEDITASVTPGETATLSYRGLRNGNDPLDDSGDINLSSFLVVYRAAE